MNKDAIDEILQSLRDFPDSSHNGKMKVYFNDFDYKEYSKADILNLSHEDWGNIVYNLVFEKIIK